MKNYISANYYCGRPLDILSAIKHMQIRDSYYVIFIKVYYVIEVNK